MIGEYAHAYLAGLGACFRELSMEALERVVEILLDAWRDRRQVFIFGNGGSAATASHMACDLGKGAWAPGLQRLRAICLSDNVPLMTAWGNDASYECIFKEQLVSLLDPGDVVIGISASGNSPNVLQAIEYANSAGAITIGLIGFGGGKLRNMVHVDVTVSSRDYGQVEDLHLSLDHILSQYLKQRLTVEASALNSNAVAA